MNSTLKKLIEAEKKASELFDQIQLRGIISSNKSEENINNEIFDLAFQLFGIKKYWHKRIVRSGENTLFPYRENPINLMVKEDDILFIDFGPIFDQWEADLGRTYVLGKDESKIKLKKDVELAWYECRNFYFDQQKITGAGLYRFADELAKKYNWTFGGEIAGHLIGHFPHEKLENENKNNYIHPLNLKDMRSPNKNGDKREWILEIHFVDRKKKIGGFFEQLLR
jgi:Xaa-Pro dipeptidase